VNLFFEDGRQSAGAGAMWLAASNIDDVVAVSAQATFPVLLAAMPTIFG